MNDLVQLAINIPNPEFQEILAFSQKKGLSVDEMVLEALHYWKREFESEKKAKTYEDGYKRLPENLKEIQAFENISLSEFETDGW
jgi:hypothetical protein